MGYINELRVVVRSIFRMDLLLGTTLLMAILDCSSSVLWVANIGDSRGVLCNSCSVPIGEVMPLSYDHKPSQVNICNDDRNSF